MSRGPGRIHRAILDAIATPEAAEPFNFDTRPYGAGLPGPVGVPVGAIFRAVYGTVHPSRTQRVAVRRAIRILEQRGQLGTYERRSCEATQEVADYSPESCPDCRHWHITRPAIGRPRTEIEEAQLKQTMDTLLGVARSIR
jgi:hypothetical protein